MAGAPDIVIPTYRPGPGFFGILQKLEDQTLPHVKIIIMNTGEEYFDRSLDTAGVLERYDNIEIHHIPEGSFNHGGTRRAAASFSAAEHLIYMTQDAEPAADTLIEELQRPFEEHDDIAVTYARQLPKDGASPIEAYNRSFNYPDTDRKKTEKDLPVLGIKTYFCSDVCACYSRRIYDELGGHEDTDFNEDMIYACRAVKAGYAVYYRASAGVYHSHDYGIKEQYRRNVELGRSQALHPEVFGNVSSESEGEKLVKGCTGYLMKNGYWYLVPRFIAECAARYMGYRKGKRICAG